MNQNLLNALNQSVYYFFFLVVDDSLDISLPQLNHFTSINSKEYNNEVNSGQLLSNPKVVEFIKNTANTHKKTPAIIPFKPSAKIDFLCKKNNWLKISNDGSLTRSIEDKLKFPTICQNLNLPILPFIISEFNKSSHQQAIEKFGPNLIVQTHFGWAGKSTYQGNNFDQLSKIIPTNTFVKFSPFIQDSYTLLNNCCLTKKGLIQSPPAIQFTGIKSLTDNPFSTVGRQWPSTAPQNIIDQILKITETFSEYLHKSNYKGFFGLDFLVDNSNNQIYLLECNPRLTASFAFYTQIEQKAGIEPLFLFHLAEFALKNHDFDINIQKERINNPKITGAQLTRRNHQNKINGKLETQTSIINSPKNVIIRDEIIRQIR